MNDKRKVVAIITVLFMSAIAATSGTFAWFVTNRTATINYGQASVYSDQGDLEVDFKHSLNSNTNNSKNPLTNEVTISGDHEVTDISGDGIDLYNVVWSATSNIAQSITRIADVAVGDIDGYFIDFTLTVSRDPQADGFKVFLGEHTALLPNNENEPKDVGILDALRMVVINYDDNDADTGNPSIIIRYTPSIEGGAKYIAADINETTFGRVGFDLVSDNDLKSHAFETNTLIDDAEDVYPAVADLTGLTTSADVTFRFWIEGMDAQATNDYLGGVFNVVLDFYALSV